MGPIPIPQTRTSLSAWLVILTTRPEREKLGMEAASDSDCDRLRGFLACTLTTLGKDSSARSEIDRPRSEL